MQDERTKDSAKVQHDSLTWCEAAEPEYGAAPDEKEAEAKILLERAQVDLMKEAGRIHKHGGFNDRELNDLKLLLKEGKYARTSAPATMVPLARRYERTAAEFRRRADAIEAELPEPEPTDVTAPAEEQTTLAPRHSRLMRSGPSAPGGAGTTLYPNAAPADGSTWGQKAAATPQPVYRATVGYVKPSKTEEDAHVRATLLAPVLTGVLSHNEAAEAWRKKFRDGVLAPEDALVLRDIPESYQRRYRNLSAKSLSRWHRKVEAAEAEAKGEGLPRPPVWQCLLHTYPSGADHPHRVRTPALVKQATTLFTEHKDWSAAQVADHLQQEAGYQGSERTIQRIVAEDITDEERAMTRGGSAARDVMFRSRLLRESPYPNHTWIIDHSFIQQEIVELDLIDQVEDFDFEFQFAVARTAPSGYVELRRTTGLWMTVIMDACTRRILCVRVWDRHPNTGTTLLALREAMMQFGVPDIVYSDNGSDFRSGDTARALQTAGVRQIFSLPYSPEGRGKIERFFRTIKERVLAGLEGYHGARHQREWPIDDLLTLEQLEQYIWVYVDRVFNHGRAHKRTKRVPAEHYDELVGAGRMQGLTAPEHLMGLLLVAKDVQKRETGFVLDGRSYWSDRLRGILNDSYLRVHYDPYRPETVFVSAMVRGGKFEFYCVAQEYGSVSGTPTPAEVNRLEAEARRQIAEGQQEREAGRRKQRRLHAGHKEGKTLGSGLAQEVMADQQAMGNPTPRAALPPAGGTSGLRVDEAEGVSTHSDVPKGESASLAAPDGWTASQRRRSREHKDGDVVVTLFDI